MVSFRTNRFMDPPKTLLHKPARKMIAEIISEAPNHDVTSIYNSEPVRNKMRRYFGDKCMLCESIPIASSAFRIDHYRPKKFIKDVDPTSHFGYYWLALEWTNLIQSCESCNSSKSNSFPVVGARVNAILKEIKITGDAYRKIDGKPLQTENRLLLHPEIDKVEDHLVFLSDGTVGEMNSSEHGKTSIAIYGLNRESLILVRKKKIDRYFKELVYLLVKFEDRGADVLATSVLKNDLYEFFRHLLGEQESTVEYSRLGFFMFDDFETFFINRLPNDLTEHKEIITKIYNDLILQSKTFRI